MTVKSPGVSWTPTPGSLRYHLYRGDMMVLRSQGFYTQDATSGPNAARFCGLNSPQTDDGYIPPVGQVVFYMVTSDNGAIEGSLGVTSAGVPRPNDHPCGVTQETQTGSPRKTR